LNAGRRTQGYERVRENLSTPDVPAGDGRPRVTAQGGRLRQIGHEPDPVPAFPVRAASAGARCARSRHPHPAGISSADDAQGRMDRLPEVGDIEFRGDTTDVAVV
jgi:hypothetical protein